MIQVVRSAAGAEKLLKPERLRMLELLKEADSASGLARKMKLPRQTVNYHLRELEKEGFIQFVERRQKGGCLERVMRATARWYVISPRVLGSLGADASDVRERFSAAYLVAAASRVIRDVAVLRQRADAAGKSFATLTLETEIRFASAQARREFTAELLETAARLAAKYHDGKADGGRRFRLVLGSYPTITKTEPAGEAPVTLE